MPSASPVPFLISSRPHPLRKPSDRCPKVDASSRKDSVLSATFNQIVEEGRATGNRPRSGCLMDGDEMEVVLGGHLMGCLCGVDHFERAPVCAVDPADLFALQRASLQIGHLVCTKIQQFRSSQLPRVCDTVHRD